MSSVRYKMETGDVKRAYNRWAPFYDNSFALFTKPYHRKMVGEINQCAGKVLDVGVGTGAQLPYYSDHLEITGIDLSDSMLERARLRVERFNLSHVKELREMDATQTPFAASSFNVISAAFVMSVVPDPRAVLAEMDRVLAPGGDIFILNHFRHEKGLRWFVERMMAPLSSVLGWHPDMPMEEVVENCPHQLVQQKEYKPFGIFTLLHFHKN